jgi:glycolate oxidase iron-sulfur subunit
MRSLERGELSANDPALLEHLDGCLGCRGCEPVCPSGVGYGEGLEAAREHIFAARGLPPLARAVLGVFKHRLLWRPLFALARLLRGTGVPHLLSGKGRFGFGMGMLAASTGQRGRRAPRQESREPTAEASFHQLASHPASPLPRPTVALFRGCVMDALFSHVHLATRRTLEVNGYEVVEVDGQVCCGALHEHAGDADAARSLAHVNVNALADQADFIVVNSAGCGALLKDYGRLLNSPAAKSIAARIKDVSELLAECGPRSGAAIDLAVAYDAPCHLQHAQRIHEPPLALLKAVPSLRLQLLPSSDRCCGSAGIYSVLRPAMARAVLDSKIESFATAQPRPDLIVTGNPGCLMQIGAGLRAAGLPIGVAHPVELLDMSYEKAGFYESERNGER